MSKESDLKYRVDLNGAVIIEEPNDDDTNISLTEVFTEEDENGEKETQLILDGIEALTTKMISRETAEYFAGRKLPLMERGCTRNNFNIAGNENILSKLKNGFVIAVKKIIEWCQLIYRKVADFILKIFGFKKDPKDFNEQEKRRQQFFDRYSEIVKLLKNANGIPNKIELPELDQLFKEVKMNTQYVFAERELLIMFNSTKIDQAAKKLTEFQKEVNNFIAEATSYFDWENKMIIDVNKAIEKMAGKVKSDKLYNNDLTALRNELSNSTGDMSKRIKLLKAVKKMGETIDAKVVKVDEDELYKTFGTIYKDYKAKMDDNNKKIDPNLVNNLEGKQMYDGVRKMQDTLFTSNLPNNKVNALADILKTIPAQLDRSTKNLVVLETLIMSPHLDAQQKAIVSDIRTLYQNVFAQAQQMGVMIKDFAQYNGRISQLINNINSWLADTGELLLSTMTTKLTSVSKGLKNLGPNADPTNKGFIAGAMGLAPIIKKFKQEMKAVSLSVSGDNQRKAAVIKAARAFDFGKDLPELHKHFVQFFERHLTNATPKDVETTISNAEKEFLGSYNEKAIPGGVKSVEFIKQTIAGFVGDVNKWQSNFKDSMIRL